MSHQLPRRDPNYDVDGLPQAIKAKITEAMKAAVDWSWIGSQPPEDHESIEENFHVARYNLERTIKTELDRLRNK